MPKEDDLKDVIAEETSRGRPQPKRVMSIEKKRKLQRAAARLADSNCTEREFLEAIRALGYEEGSPEFEKCVKLWREFRG
ncbi:MAG: hypothetical protein ACRD2L_15800 [Terriglobia bacterium]